MKACALPFTALTVLTGLCTHIIGELVASAGTLGQALYVHDALAFDSNDNFREIKYDKIYELVISK